jgi:hypothetical protein
LTEIQPSVSLANLPQLSVDLLITTLELKRVGWIGKGDTVAPFSGVGEDGEIVTGGLEGESCEKLNRILDVKRNGKGPFPKSELASPHSLCFDVLWETIIDIY